MGRWNFPELVFESAFTLRLTEGVAFRYATPLSRIFLILFFALASCWIIASYRKLDGMDVNYTPAAFLLVWTGQFLFQLPAVIFAGRRLLLLYWCHQATCCLAGALLLVPVLVLRECWTAAPLLNLLWYLLVLLIMTVTHYRQCRRLGLPFLLTLSWAAYLLLISIPLKFIGTITY